MTKKTTLTDEEYRKYSETITECAAAAVALRAWCHSQELELVPAVITLSMVLAEISELGIMPESEIDDCLAYVRRLAKKTHERLKRAT